MRGSKPDIKPLSMQLAGVIDAAVQGGIQKYKDAFFTGTYLQENPHHSPHIANFKLHFTKQLPLLQRVNTINILLYYYIAFHFISFIFYFLFFFYF